MQLSGVKKEMLISSLVFMIAPRVNAAGRMDDAKKSSADGAISMITARPCMQKCRGAIIRIEKKRMLLLLLKH